VVATQQQVAAVVFNFALSVVPPGVSIWSVFLTQETTNVANTKTMNIEREDSKQGMPVVVFTFFIIIVFKCY
jgi:hypothetical protein